MCLYPLVVDMITQNISDSARCPLGSRIAPQLILISLRICAYVVKVYQKIIINAKLLSGVI